MTVFSKPETKIGGSTKRKVIPPIPLERPTKKELHKGDYQTYKLRNVPADENSPVYELSVPYFRTGTCEEWLIFRKNLEKVILGQNVTNGPGRFIVARRLLEGDALTVFNNEAQTHTTNNGNASETAATFALCLDAVTKSVFPKRAVLLQKRYMRRFVRKPVGMTTRDYVARISEMNSYLPLFPSVTANGEVPTKLPDDEILDLLEFGVPNSWQRTMILQDFDPLQKSIAEFVQFCERLEEVEETPTSTKNNNHNKKSNKRAQSGDTSGNKTQTKTGKHCLLHGDNCGHTTDQCFTLKAQAKRMRQTYDAQTPAKKQVYKNKQELNAIVANAVEEALNGASKTKKRKTNKKGKTEELNAFASMSITSDSDSGDDSSVTVN